MTRKTKRSAYVGFTLMTASATGLAGCGQPQQPSRGFDGPPPAAAPAPVSAAAAEEPQLFANVEECRTQTDPAQCEAAFQQAQAEHLQTAPKYAAKGECEQGWGENGCQEVRTAGGSIFMPLMAGFLLGRMMGGGGFGRPVHMSPSGAMYSGRNQVGQGGFGARAGGLSRQTDLRSTPSGVTERGGFGSTASGRSYGG